VIVYGNLELGIEGVLGPFDSESEAEEYAENHTLGHTEKLVFEVENYG